MATLRYKVGDAAPTKGTATVVIKVKNRAGRVVTTIKAGAKTVNAPLTAKFRCTRAKGTYKYYVYATDASGNYESKAGSAKLTVKSRGDPGRSLTHAGAAAVTSAAAPQVRGQHRRRAACVSTYAQ